MNKARASPTISVKNIKSPRLSKENPDFSQDLSQENYEMNFKNQEKSPKDQMSG